MSIYRGKNKKEFYLASLLYDAIEDRDLNSIKSLLADKGADPNIVLPKKEISPFHLAIGCDSNDFAKTVTAIILQYGGNPNVKSDDGLTPVHVAAAWGRIEILHLLLSCGGDPEKRDIDHKTPLHYAFEENFPDCLNLLKTFVPNNIEIISHEEDEPVGYNIILDKIVVNNGTEIGEYEIVKEYDKNSITSKTLQLLPQADTTEYVMNWFNNQLNHNAKTINYMPGKTAMSSTDGVDSFESSVDESDVEVKKTSNVEHITFRKVYKKTRKISKDSTASKKSDLAKRSFEKSSFKDVDNLNHADAEGFTFQNFSKESGIVTLPNSTKEVSDFFQENSLVSKEIAVTKQDASSDYMTCSVHSDPQGFDKNIFEITEDLSGNLFTSDESKVSNKTKVSSELSFVSVSEVYKYIDEDEGVVLFEKRILKTPTNSEFGSIKSNSFCSKISSLPETVDYDTDTLRKELATHGFNPGPITVTTKRVYLKKLRQLKKEPVVNEIVQVTKKVYSYELEKTLKDATWFNDVAIYRSLEDVIVKQFSTPDPSRKWREGLNKSSFTYLLLDPRVTNNLPCRADQMQPYEIWETFLSAIFYVGKGKRSRPYSHLYESVTLWNKQEYNSPSKKLQNIIDIWKTGNGVICLHVFQNTIPVEAYTREAAMISALKLENVSNKKSGDYYGIAATWTHREKKMLGVYLLYKAMMIFLNEGERQLCPSDID